MEKTVHRPISDKDIEVLLASANAIQRLIAERDALYRRVDLLERELVRLQHAAGAIMDSCRKLTTVYISQFEKLDREAVQLLSTLHEPSDGAMQTAAARQEPVDTLHEHRTTE